MVFNRCVAIALTSNIFSMAVAEIIEDRSSVMGSGLCVIILWSMSSKVVYTFINVVIKAIGINSHKYYISLLCSILSHSITLLRTYVIISLSFHFVHYILPIIFLFTRSAIENTDGTKILEREWEYFQSHTMVGFIAIKKRYFPLETSKTLANQ